eukprot:gene21392-25697_t
MTRIEEDKIIPSIIEIATPNGSPLIHPQFISWGDLIITQSLTKDWDSNQFIIKLNATVYAIALTVENLMANATKDSTIKRKKRQADILTKRSEYLRIIGYISAEVNRRETGKPITRKMKQNMVIIKRMFCGSTKSVQKLKSLLHTLKERLTIVQYRLKEDNRDSLKRALRKKNSAQLFQKTSRTQAPINKVREYWSHIIGQGSSFKPDNHLRQWAKTIPTSNFKPISHRTEITNWEINCKNAKLWKAPGPDQIPMFWWLKIRAANYKLYRWIYNRLTISGETPDWLSHGRAIPLYKGGDPADPSNYRTICCLNTCYKLMTGLLTQWLNIWGKSILPTEQIALKKSVWGCIQAHLLDNAACQYAVKSRKNLSIAWIDYTKAFDSIPHGLIKWILRKMTVPLTVRNALKSIMDHWKIRYESYENGRMKRSDLLTIRKGTLQGDTLSPLLFYEDNAYKYLGIEQNVQSCNNTLLQRLKNE